MCTYFKVEEAGIPCMYTVQQAVQVSNYRVARQTFFAHITHLAQVFIHIDVNTLEKYVFFQKNQPFSVAKVKYLWRIF